MSCILRIGGENFDSENFVQRSKMEWEQNVYKGVPAATGSKRISDTSYVSVATSNAGFTDHKQQIIDTIEFFIKYKNNLHSVINTSEIDYAVVDFGVDINEKYAIQSFSFPVELVKLCSELGIGIEISTYNGLYFAEDSEKDI